MTPASVPMVLFVCVHNAVVREVRDQIRDRVERLVDSLITADGVPS